MGIAPSSSSTLEEQIVSLLENLQQDISVFLITDHGSKRNSNQAVLAVTSMLVASATRLSVFCVLMLFKGDVEQGAAGMISDKSNASTLATVPTIGPTKFDKFFTTKGGAARSSLAGADMDLDRINKFHGRGRASDAEEVEELLRQLHPNTLVEVMNEWMHRRLEASVVALRIILTS